MVPSQNVWGLWKSVLTICKLASEIILHYYFLINEFVKVLDQDLLLFETTQTCVTERPCHIGAVTN